jgi:cold shock CspA family protein
MDRGRRTRAGPQAGTLQRRHSCRVDVAQDHKHPRSGETYRVRIEVTMPRKKRLVVIREPPDQGVQLKTVIRDAFHAMERHVKEAGERRLFPDQDYGFIKAPAGEEYYFHRNAVLHDDYDRLAVGTEVRFEAEMGEMGPPASAVQIVSKPAARVASSSRRRDALRLAE